MSLDVVLGLGGYTADSGACVLAGGRLVAALAEERLSRVKGQGGWPHLSVPRVLELAGLTLSDVQRVSFCYELPRRLFHRIPAILRQFPSHPGPSAIRLRKELRRVASAHRKLHALRRGGLRVRAVRHHLCHAAAGFFTSPFEEAALYTADGIGEWDTATLGHGQGSRIRLLETTSMPHSLGLFYNAMTRHLGFGRFDDYKVMGLASYGEPCYADRLRRFLRPDAPGRFRIDTAYLLYPHSGGLRRGSYLSPRFHEEFGPPRLPAEPLTDHHRDLAASAQQVFEECVFHQLRHLHALTGSERLCIAGGCGLNGVMNGRIYENTPFRHVFVPPVAGDDGVGIGGALYLHHHVDGHPRTESLARADLGTRYSDAEIEAGLRLRKLPYRRLDEVAGPTAELIAAGKVVGWFQGAMEVGPRALGHRSILAHPGLPDMPAELNARVKFREEFRPFAPSVLEEEAGRYFEVRDPIPFMTMVVPVTEEGRRLLPATTHVDGTARAHTVGRDQSPLYRRLLEELGKRTGTPVVLNTSFNVRGEPIVESPDQALASFYASGLDALVIGSFLIEKGASPA